MITFTDVRKYVLGIGVAYATDPGTGDFLYWSDKFQEGNVTVSGSDQVLSAGIGNAPAIIIPTDPNVSVNITAGDYGEYIKSASVGGKITYGAPAVACQTVQASGTSLTISVANGTPIAGPGMEDVVCYVQEVGAESPIATGGVAYALNPTSGAITGFTATSGKTYLVTYYVAQANASMTTITGNIKGKVVRFVLQRPIYVNVDSSTNQGDLWGMLYEIVPRLQLMPDTAANAGGQTAYTTTGIVGRAIQFDAETITAGCDQCSLTGAPLMYRVIVPCDKTAGIDGILGALGGAVSLAVDATLQLNPAVIVDGKLSYSVPASEFEYSSSATGVATVEQYTGLVSGESAGSAEITVTYTVGSETYTDYVNVEVTST